MDKQKEEVRGIIIYSKYINIMKVMPSSSAFKVSFSSIEFNLPNPPKSKYKTALGHPMNEFPYSVGCLWLHLSVLLLIKRVG